jgi:hypothetical protein
MLQHLSPHQLKGLQLRGQVASLSGRYRYAIMAGEIYLPEVEYKLASISNIESIVSYCGRHYRAK